MYALLKAMSSLQFEEAMTGLQRDFTASALRSQISALRELLLNIEISQKVEVVYVKESLRRAEKELHRLRLSCGNN